MSSIDDGDIIPADLTDFGTTIDFPVSAVERREPRGIVAIKFSTSTFSHVTKCAFSKSAISEASTACTPRESNVLLREINSSTFAIVSMSGSPSLPATMEISVSATNTTRLLALASWGIGDVNYSDANVYPFILERKENAEAEPEIRNAPFVWRNVRLLGF